MQAIIAIISIFIVYVVVPFSFRHQFFLASATAIGEALIVLFIVKPSETTVLFTVLYCLLLSSVIAATSSWQLHAYRRRTYSEVIHRKEIQEKLENYSKQLEKTVKERTERLKNAERFAAIGATAGMVGHDLRNPLTGISNAAYYLNKKYNQQFDEQGQDMLQIIQKNVEYSNKIINDLLDYAGNINLENLVVTTPKTLVDESLELVSFPSNIKVVNQTQAAPEVKVDSVKMKRVLVNILKNGVDAMPDGGALILNSTEEGDTTKIIVSDTGVGIPQDALDKLFQPLYTTKAKGMGFGLAICQRIVEAHKGKISVESKVGLGTKMTIELPTYKANAPVAK
jgi:signal transduction histidine kinase